MCLKYLKEYFKKHGLAKIVYQEYPAEVQPRISFIIKYKVENIGYTDTVFGRLLVEGVELTGSYWKQKIKKKGQLIKTFNHSGLKKDTKIILEVGYE